MSFSSFQEFFCFVGLSLIVYSRTFPRWLRETAEARYIASKETLAVMKAKLSNYEKIQEALKDLEQKADEMAVFSSPKEELEFKVSLVNETYRQNDDLLMANAKMEVATEAIERATVEMRQRAIESGSCLLFGILFLATGLVLLAKQ